MTKLTFSAAAVLAISALVAASAPASAVENWGPSKNGSQCFKVASGESKDMQFGHWGDCPQTASAPVAAATTQHRRIHRTASR
jgi:uncharacterized membrane protein